MTRLDTRAALGLLAGAVLFAGGAADVHAQSTTTQALASTGADGDAVALATLRTAGGSTEFDVELEDIAPGAYDLLVAGVVEGQIVVGGNGEGEIEFEVPLAPPYPLLDFTVSGRLVEVRRGGTTFFSDVFDSSGGGPFEAIGWTDLGGALAGSEGLPVLVGEGPPVGGTLATLEVDDGPDFGTAFLVLGITRLDAPFKGGLLVPSPDVLLPPVALDLDGDVDLPLTVPAGLPAGLELFWQVWFPDVGGPAGFSATNGLRATTL